MAIAQEIAKALVTAAEEAREAYQRWLNGEIDKAEKAMRTSYEGFCAAGKWLKELPDSIATHIKITAETFYFGFFRSFGLPIY